MIHVRDLSVAYGQITALRQVSFDVAAGECLVITGPSGCGKSTLGRILTGLIPQVIPAQISGDVYVAGLDVLHQPTAAIATLVGAVFQNPRSQLFHLRVTDEVAFGPSNLGWPESEIVERVDWALEAVGMSDLRNHKPAELSGGQMQRLAIASTLAMNPQVLVLDEPTASLDALGTQQVITALQSLRDQFGLTIVLIEHRLAEVSRLANRVLILDEGQIAAEGAFHAVLGDSTLRQRFGFRRPTDEPLAPWKTLLTPNGKLSSSDSLMLSIESVTAGYNGHPIIQDINLQVRAGEFIALVGDNGAGKTTLGLVAAGLLKPVTGRVQFASGRRPRPGLDVTLLFQNPSDQFFTNSVDEEISFGPENYRQFEADWHMQVLASTDLLGLRARRPLSLSIGQQQRSALAACLALKPRLFILDEPTLGQDWRHLQQLMDFLTVLNRHGTAILLITHDFKLVHHYARRVVLMQTGRIVLDGHLRHPVDPESAGHVIS